MTLVQTGSGTGMELAPFSQAPKASFDMAFRQKNLDMIAFFEMILNRVDITKLSSDSAVAQLWGVFSKYWKEEEQGDSGPSFKIMLEVIVLGAASVFAQSDASIEFLSHALQIAHNAGKQALYIIGAAIIGTGGHNFNSLATFGLYWYNLTLEIFRLVHASASAQTAAMNEPSITQSWQALLAVMQSMPQQIGEYEAGKVACVEIALAYTCEPSTEGHFKGKLKQFLEQFQPDGYPPQIGFALFKQVSDVVTLAWYSALHGIAYELQRRIAAGRATGEETSEEESMSAEVEEKLKRLQTQIDQIQRANDPMQNIQLLSYINRKATPFLAAGGDPYTEIEQQYANFGPTQLGFQANKFNYQGEIAPSGITRNTSLSDLFIQSTLKDDFAYTWRVLHRGAWRWEDSGGGSFFSYVYFPVIGKDPSKNSRLGYLIPVMYSSFPLTMAHLNRTTTDQLVNYQPLVLSYQPYTRVYLDLDYVLGEDARKSIVAALMFASVKSESYITFGVTYPIKGSSMGLALYLAIMGAPPVAATGFLYSDEGGDLLQDDIVEHIDLIEDKIALAKRENWPLVCPHKDVFGTRIKTSLQNFKESILTSTTLYTPDTPPYFQKEPNKHKILLATSGLEAALMACTYWDFAGSKFAGSVAQLKKGQATAEAIQSGAFRVIPGISFKGAEFLQTQKTPGSEKPAEGKGKFKRAKEESEAEESEPEAKGRYKKGKGKKRVCVTTKKRK